MKKLVLIAALLAVPSFGPTVASAGDVGYSNSFRDVSVMGGQSIVDMGAASRAASDKVISSSRADMSTANVGVNYVHQFGSSQSEQSWKTVKTPDKAPVPGLVAGDCRGDNSSDDYRKRMGQSREGYMKESIVSQAECEIDHATVGGTGAVAHSAH